MARTTIHNPGKALRGIANDLESDAREVARDAVRALDEFARGGALRDFAPHSLRHLTGIVSDVNALRRIADRRFGKDFDEGDAIEG